jgi:hypothetical protein
VKDKMVGVVGKEKRQMFYPKLLIALRAKSKRRQQGRGDDRRRRDLVYGDWV